MIKNFRTYDLAVEFYRVSKTLALPAHLKDQLLRASSSIVLNLAEGAGRQRSADQYRFYRIAFGSLRECQAILSLEITSNEAADSADRLAAHLYRLIKSPR